MGCAGGRSGLVSLWESVAGGVTDCSLLGQGTTGLASLACLPLLIMAASYVVVSGACVSEQPAGAARPATHKQHV